MTEPHPAPRAQPVFRRQRLVRVGEATTLVGQASSHIAPVPAAAGPALPSPTLERQVWLAVEASRLLRLAQPILEAERTPTAAQEVLGLVQMLLQVLFEELAAGADARVDQVAGVFALLLNAPGHAGLIEQGLLALSAPATTAAPVQRSAGDPAALEALRRLHRDLVALFLSWEALLDRALPPAGRWSAAPGRPATASAPQVPPLLTSLPAGVVVGHLPLGRRLVAHLARGFTRPPPTSGAGADRGTEKGLGVNAESSSAPRPPSLLEPRDRRQGDVPLEDR